MGLWWQILWEWNFTCSTDRLSQGSLKPLGCVLLHGTRWEASEGAEGADWFYCRVILYHLWKVMVIQSCLSIRKKKIIIYHQKNKEDLENHLLVSLTSVPAKILDQILLEPTPTQKKNPKTNQTKNNHQKTQPSKKPKPQRATENRQYRLTKGIWYLTNLAACFKGRPGLVSRGKAVNVTLTGTVTVFQTTLSEESEMWPEGVGYQVGGLLARPPGFMGFDEQYKVQLTDIHQWCPSEVRTAAHTG